MISILLPTYNQADFLPDALAGLYAQTRRDFEVIAYNDGSTDATADILRLARVQTINHPDNLGTANAINVAAALANPDAEYMTWVSSDNVMHPDWLKRLAGVLDLRRDFGAVYSAFNYCDGDKARAIRQGPYAPGKLVSSENCYFGPSFLIRRCVWQPHRGQSSHDYENWARVEEACWNLDFGIGYVDEPLCDYRVGAWQTVRQHPERYDADKWRAEAIERRCVTPDTTDSTRAT